jgi:hypothetical protein
MTADRDGEIKSSPIDRVAVVRFRIYEMMTIMFPGWPPDALEKIIYEETDPRQAGELIQHFFDERFLDELPHDLRNAAAEEVISVIRDAWNYLPHKRLGGRSPAELMEDKSG